MYIDLANTDQSWQDVYKIIVSFVNPRPIALVSSISPDGVRNLAPFSFYNMVSANPPIMMVAPSKMSATASCAVFTRLSIIPHTLVCLLESNNCWVLRRIS